MPYGTFGTSAIDPFAADPFARLAIKPYDFEEPSPEEEESFLAKLGRKSLSAAQTVGNTLDTPRAMLWAALSGNNPLAAAADTDKRIYGEDLLHSLGVEDTSGWLPWIASRALEIGGDPTTYLGGLGLLGKFTSTAGRASKAAGLMEHLASGAAKTADVGLLTGKRTKLLKLTPAHLLEAVPAGERGAAREAFDFAARKLGVDDPSTLLHEPLGGPIGARIPFTNAEFMPQGKLTEAYASGRDKLGEWMKFGNPVTGGLGRNVSALFDRSVRGITDPVGRKLAQAMTAAEDVAVPEARRSVFEAEKRLTEGGLRGTPTDELRRAAEYPSQAAPGIREAYQPVHDEFRKQLLKDRREGLNVVHEMQDPTLEARWPRAMSPEFDQPTHGRGLLGTGEKERVIRGVPGGAVRVNELGKKAAAILEQGGDGADIARMLDAEGIAKSMTIGGEEVRVRDQLVESFLGIGHGAGTEELGGGIFRNDPLFDAERAASSQGGAVARRSTALKNLADTTVQEALKGKAFKGQKLVDIDDSLSKMGFGKTPTDALGTMANELTKQTGKVTSVQDLVDKVKLPKGFLEALTKADTPLAGPEAAQGIKKLYDQFTSVFKAGVLLHPAQHTRNLTSGQIQNFVTARFSTGTVADMKRIIGGGVVKDAEGYAKIPWVAKELGSKPATPENITAILRKEVAAQELVSPLGKSGDIAQTLAKGTLEDVSSDVPGRTPMSFADPFKTLAGQDPKTEWLPFSHGKSNVRNLGEAKETTFFAGKASEQANYLTEAANRLSPWLKAIKEGTSPTEAAKLVTASQVKYNNALTPFERDVMARAFPFYRFGKGILSHTAETLAEKPGGRLAQVLRAQNAVIRQSEKENKAVPEHVRETLAIPIEKDTLLGNILGTPNAEDTQRYLTGLGLMHEDALKLLPGTTGVGDQALELMSRTNPLIKAGLELPMGRSTFQRGPEGGRDLAELDPTLGRIMSNVAGLEGPVGTPSSLEYALGMSPASRAMTSLRVATDPRKDPINKIVNILSGVRTTDVSPQQVDAMARAELNKAMREAGAKSYNDPSFSKDAISKMAPEEQKVALQYMELRRILQKRSKERKKKAA